VFARTVSHLPTRCARPVAKSRDMISHPLSVSADPCSASRCGGSRRRAAGEGRRGRRREPTCRRQLDVSNVALLLGRRSRRSHGTCFDVRKRDDRKDRVVGRGKTNDTRSRRYDPPDRLRAFIAGSGSLTREHTNVLSFN